MNEATIRTLAMLEYDAIAIHADLDDLAGRLQLCADSPRALVAARQVRRLREMLAHVLDRLDQDVTAAIAATQALGSAPF